ncbi:MAG TPA: phenylalanine--tRNA ligase subunit beta [Chloroflexota bacterium]|nr:phenylalanine--tRNA ligase subunit beta [Chloroflexota bacterium]
MKVPLRWLNDYVNVTLSPLELAEKLTMSGSLVERVTNSGAHLDDFLVARIENLERVPNSDHLWLAHLDLGDKHQTVVTGAQNLFPGAIVPYIGVGKKLPGMDAPLRPKKLAGVVSEGMVCSGRELGLSEDQEGILILDTLVEGDRAADAVGQPLSQLLGEWVIDLEITPNRPDCLSMIGVAREVAAVTGATFRLPEPKLVEASPPASRLASVHIEAKDLCRRFVARVIIGVTVGPSPTWLAERLNAAGMRSINNVVDVTNYVMLEYGQPMHAYDLDLVAGHVLTARKARAGEQMTTLDGVARTLSPDMLVIADRDHAVGIAGIMGGIDSEINQQTTKIFLELANFHPRGIRRTSQALGLRSEASSRFEKGLPILLPRLAADRAAALLAEVAGGVVAEGVLDAGQSDAVPQVIPFDSTEVHRLLGVSWTTEQIVGSLLALGFICAPTVAGNLEVTVPWWREDLQEGADLVEEVARINGYDAIPETLLSGSVAPRPESPGQRWYWAARSTLLACGLSEGSSPGLTSLRLLELLRPDDSTEWLAAIVPNPDPVRAAGATFHPMAVVNPLTPDRQYLRSTLLAGLLEAARDNLRAGEDRVAFFELDTCSFPRAGDLPVERRTLAIAMAGRRTPRSWATPETDIDFFDLKGVIEELLTRLGIVNPRISVASHPLLHPGRAADLRAGGAVLGYFGELHPRVAERWDLGTHRAYIAEFDFDELAMQASAERAFAEYPRVPFAKRDLAVVVDQATLAEEVLRVIRAAGKNRIARVTLFDVYQGGQVPEGKKSLACALDLQSPDSTLREEEVEQILVRIRKALQHQVGASFRE